MERQSGGEGGPSATVELSLQDDKQNKSRSLTELVISLSAEADSEPRSNSRSTSKSKAADRSVRSTQALTSKQLGEIAEAEFIAKAVGMGFVVAKPWGDSEPYDFIVNTRKNFNFWRVQVKSAHTVGADGGCSFNDFNSFPGARS